MVRYIALLVAASILGVIIVNLPGFIIGLGYLAAVHSVLSNTQFAVPIISGMPPIMYWWWLGSMTLLGFSILFAGAVGVIALARWLKNRNSIKEGSES